MSLLCRCTTFPFDLNRFGPTNAVGDEILEARDGGYLIGADVLWREGGPSVGLIKLDADGSIEWQRSYHRTPDDRFASLQTSSDTRYILAASGGEVVQTSPYAEAWDVSILKLDGDGELQCWRPKMVATCSLGVRRAGPSSSS